MPKETDNTISRQQLSPTSSGVTSARRSSATTTSTPQTLEQKRTDRYVKDVASGDDMWGYQESDLDMSGYDAWAEKNKGGVQHSIGATKGRDEQTWTTEASREEYAKQMAYNKALAENQFGLQDHLDKLRKEKDSGNFLSDAGSSLWDSGKNIGQDLVDTTKEAAPYAAGMAALMGGAYLAAPAFAGAGAAGAAAGGTSGGFAAANVTGAGGMGLYGGGAAAGAGGLAGSGWTSGFAANQAPVKGGGGMLDFLTQGVGGSGLSYGDAILGGLGWWDSQNAMDDSRDAIEAGYQRDNPFAQHQPEMAQNFLNVTRDPSALENTPGYKFTRDQGLEALWAKQASTGQRFSGRALNESMAYGSGLASQIYNAEIDRMARWAGADQGYSGGAAYGQNMSQIGQQDSFNNFSFLGDMWSRYQNPTTSPTQNTNAYNWMR